METSTNILNFAAPEIPARRKFWVLPEVFFYSQDFSSTSSYISANQITPPVYLSPERWHWQPSLISACQEPAPSSGAGQELHRSYLEWERECKSGKALLPVLPSSGGAFPSPAACYGQCREAEVRDAKGGGGCLLPVDWQPGSQGLDSSLLICKEEAVVELPAVVTVWQFAELALFRCHRVLRAVLRSVRPPAWEMGVISLRRVGTGAV